MFGSGSKIVAINVDGEMLKKLTELFGGEVASQVEGALKQAGVSVPEEKEQPKQEEPQEEEKAFGYLIDTDLGEYGWKGSYNVKGAQSISIKAIDDTIVIKGVDADGDEVAIDTFYVTEEDCTGDLSAYVEDDVLTVTIPIARKAKDGQEFTVGGLNEEDGDWCDDCQEYHQ